MPDRRVFESMNGLRGVAALSVVAFHWSLRDPLKLSHGYLAVDLFFVLSGFVIAHAYGRRLLTGWSKISFAIVRVIRLYPLYILGTLISIAVILLSLLLHGLTDANRYYFSVFPFAALMAPYPPFAMDWADANLYPLNLPAWSLFFEIVANIAYVLFTRVYNIRILILFVVVIGLTLLARLFLDGSIYGEGGTNWSSIHLGVLRVFYSFPIGILIYELYKSGFVFPRIPSFVIIGALPLALIAPAITHGAYLDAFNVLVTFPALVALAATSDEPTGRFAAVCGALGAASYAVYAVHQPLHTFIGAMLQNLHGKPAPLLMDAILLTMIVPLCLLIDRVYDAPIRRFLSRRFLPQK